MVAKVLVNAIINAWNEEPTSNLKEVHIVDIDANVIKMAVKCLHEKGYKTEYVVSLLYRCCYCNEQAA